MIIRKPFAFLVHKFKLLHFIILIPIIYLSYMLYNLMEFFNDFVVAGYVTNIEGVVSKYYSFIMLIAAIIIIAFMALVNALFKKKNKFALPYSIIILYNIALIIYILLLPSLLLKAQNAELSSSASLIVRGVSSIFFYLNIITVIITLLLTFGFDFKTGEFLSIRDEINLDEEDNEEVEINIKSEDYKYKRLVNRYIREIKYYVIENKNIFKVLLGILGVIVLLFAVKFLISLNRVVRVEQNFNYSNFTFKFNSSVLSTLDYGGNTISNDKVFLATKVTVTNITKGLVTIKTDDFCLSINNDCYYPVLDRSGKFLDLAKPYYGEKIGQGQEAEYVLVYELPSNLTMARYKIKILDSLTYKNDELIPKYKEITLTPSYSNSVKDVSKVNMSEEITFDKTALNNTKLKVNSYDLVSNYRYTYQYCYKEKCSDSLNVVNASSGKMLLVLNEDYIVDNEASYFKNKLGSNSFFQDFGKIKYTINGNEYVIGIVDKTPKDLENRAVLEVNSSIKEADKIELLLTIRDKRYTINLK